MKLKTYVLKDFLFLPIRNNINNEMYISTTFIILPIGITLKGKISEKNAL